MSKFLNLPRTLLSFGSENTLFQKFDLIVNCQDLLNGPWVRLTIVEKFLNQLTPLITRKLFRMNKI